ncbi:hypothetical protein BGW80DRAFT_1564806 [Lactifluus volemus]|nr:hypothetical protein BGW80DRAFT_1564806 [Lactifluus volemus]
MANRPPRPLPTHPGPVYPFGLSSDLNENVPGATLIGPYASMNHPSFGYPSQSTGNLRLYDSSSQVSGSGEQPQCAYQGDQWQNVPYCGPPPGTAQPILDLCPSPLWPEYYAQPVRPQPEDSDMLVDGTTIGHGSQPPNVTLHSQGIPGPAPSEMSVGEELGQLVNQYLHNPNGRRSASMDPMFAATSGQGEI